ncbi:MAG: ROK family protein [Paracoccaceae bacterium]|nr:ROK family protein [Paracoccaceae bacterium]
MICGGIDVGGTKIEARLFEGEGFAPGAGQRWATPQDSYEAFLAQIADAVRWLGTQAGDTRLPVGLALAGPVDGEGGVSHAVNTVARGHSVGRDLSRQVGRHTPLINDCVAFTLSEATGGAADGARSVVGITFGTGLGAGHVVDGALAVRFGGHGAEIGHAGLSARLRDRHDLPDLPCGCGRRMCLEAYLSAGGLATLLRHRTGRNAPLEAIADDPLAEPALSIWFEIVAEALGLVYLALAPDVIVLGGGLSQMSGFSERTRAALSPLALPPLPLPEIALARFGGASGARGAAIHAWGARDD